MMEKNWLIRTHNFKILGPVSKEKVLELVEKKALHDEDELCPGNGFWFFVREKDMLDQFVFGDIPSTFNPVSEAPSHLSRKAPEEMIRFLDQLEKGFVKPPPKPSAPSAQPNSDVTLVTNLNDLKGQLAEEEKNASPDQGKMPSEDDLAYPDMTGITQGVLPPAPTKSEATSSEDLDDHIRFHETPSSLEMKLPDSFHLAYPQMESPRQDPPSEKVEEAPSVKPQEELPAVPLEQEKTPEPPPVASIKKATPSPTQALKIVPNTKKAEIDPMVLLQISNAGRRTNSAPTKRNDHFLIILFVIILGVIGVLFLQYKEMVKKTVAARHAKMKTQKNENAAPDEEAPSPLVPEENTENVTP